MHAGDYLYVLVGAGKYVNNSIFIWPAVLLILSYFFPAAADFMDSTPVKTSRGAIRHGKEALFIAIAYSIGFFLVFVPEAAMYALYGESINYQMLSPEARDEVTVCSIAAIMGACSCLLLYFNLFNGLTCDTLTLKTLNWLIVTPVLGSLIVYAFPVVLIGIAFGFPLLQNSVSLFGWSASKDQRQSKCSLLTSIIVFLMWLSLCISVLLGTVLFSKDDPMSKLTTIRSMLTTAISDW